MAEKEKLLIDFLKVIADSTRLRILELLRNNELNSSTIQKQLNKGQSTISQQLKILLQANLIDFRREGVNKIYFLKNNDIFRVFNVISSFIKDLNQEKVDLLFENEVHDILHG